MPSVAIVGGGFCGIVTAVNLVRLTDAPLSVTVIHHGSPFGRGIAYGTRRPEHLLNVVARNMAALADQPDHFVEWLGTRAEFAHLPLATLRETFVPRRVYGDYLQSLYLWYARAYADGKQVRVERWDDEATDVAPDAGQVTVHTASGRTLAVDKVVLATGNPPPAALQGVPADHPAYFANPWDGWEERLQDPHDPVVFVGTGLTMIDCYLALQALGWQGKIVALSRTGLLPLPHFKGFDSPGIVDDSSPPLGLDRLVTLFNLHCERLRQEGLNPAILVDKLRPHTQRLWQGFTREEKERFLREHRTRWNVTRHRVPEGPHREVTAAIAAGKLEVVAGRIRSCTPQGERLRLEVEGKSGPRVLECAALINCTGPAEGAIAGESPLLRNLLERGLVSVDEVGLGIRATPYFVALDEAGKPSRHLLALGPLLKGMLWETTAVPELRNQAFRVAEVIVSDIHAQRTAVRAVEETYADVIEYSI